MADRDRKDIKSAADGFEPGARADESIAFTLDRQRLTARPGETIWLAAQRHGISILHACLSLAPDFQPDGNCRLCLVEVEGYRTLQPSCRMKASEGLVVFTDSKRAVQARRIVMELLLSDAAIDAGSECGRVAAAMGVTASRFSRSATHRVCDDSHPGIAVDLARCIRCMRCIQACREVEVNNVIGMAGRGPTVRVVFDFDDPMGRSTCVSCGSCAQACPTGAIAFKARPNG